jgi:hypothetical protein
MHDTIIHDHAQVSPHDHAQVSPHAHTCEQAPDNADNLILDIGADTGALIIHAAMDHDQAEIEISPAGSVQARAHNIVRRRETVSGAVYAAVFPALTAGDYVVWRDAATPAGTVVVHGGRVASFRLDLGSATPVSVCRPGRRTPLTAHDHGISPGSAEPGAWVGFTRPRRPRTG